MIWDFRVGDVMSFLGYFGGTLIFLMTMKGELKLLAQRLGFLENTVKDETKEQNRKIDSLSELLMKMVRFEERMANFDTRLTGQGKEIQEMKHGDGIILKHQ